MSDDAKFYALWTSAIAALVAIAVLTPRPRAESGWSAHTTLPPPCDQSIPGLELKNGCYCAKGVARPSAPSWAWDCPAQADGGTPVDGWEWK